MVIGSPRAYLWSNRARNFKSASRFALVRFWNYSRDYSLSCTPLDPVAIKEGMVFHSSLASCMIFFYKKLLFVIFDKIVK